MKSLIVISNEIDDDMDYVETDIYNYEHSSRQENEFDQINEPGNHQSIQSAITKEFNEKYVK